MAAHQASRPWDSPGKNTGVGCHFLLQCMKVKSESEVAQLCPTLATPWAAAYQAPPSMGFSRQKYWSGVLLPSLVSTLELPYLILTNHSKRYVTVIISGIKIRNLRYRNPVTCPGHRTTLTWSTLNSFIFDSRLPRKRLLRVKCWNPEGSFSSFLPTFLPSFLSF